MVFVPLKVTPCYRAWRMGGVQHVLMSPEAVENVATLIRTPFKRFASTSLAPATDKMPKSLPEQPIVNHLASAPSSNASAQTSANALATPVSDIQGASMPSRDASFASNKAQSPPKPSLAKQNPAKQNPAKQNPVGDSTLSEASMPVDKLAYEHWPEPWQQRLAASASKPFVVWSYAALRQDFGGQADAARAAILREIYDGMGLCKGSHVLWPLQLMTDAAPRPDIFREAMTILQPRVLVLLYDTVPEGLGIAPLTCYQSAFPASLSGLTVVLGPAMEKLVFNASETLVSNASTLSPLLHIIQQLLGALPEGARVR